MSFWDKTARVAAAPMTGGASLLPKIGGAGGNFLNNLGFGTSQATKDAQANTQAAVDAYGNLIPPELTPENPQYAQTSDQGPSAMEGISVNPEYNAAQVEQLAALRNLAQNGGRNAASDAALAEIQQRGNANARGQNEAILQNANARGVGGSGAALQAQLDAQQNQTTNQAAQDMAVKGQEANTALAAGQGAANIGAGLENQGFNEAASKAAAADAINRFNAANKTSTNQFNTGIGNNAQQFNTNTQQQTYQNKANKAQGISNAYTGAANFNQKAADTGAQQAGNILAGGVKIGTAGMTGKNASEGGQIPGEARLSGDSSLNDFVPINASPGEVVVPRSLAKGGNEHDIGAFVKHPPQIEDDDNESRMAALESLRRRAA